MIAWGYEEGGNIGNNSSFNVWNTGINIPALLSTANSTSGVQSFISYDAGVEGNTITMTTSNQSRIGTLLSDPNSSASQVLTAIATPSAYSGNQGWATDPNYLSKLLAMLPQTQNDYSQMASVEIGPNQENQNHVPVSELQFAGGTGSASIGTTTASCISGGSGGNCQSGTKSAILCAAQQYTGIYYTLGGGHDPYTSFRKGCPISSISSAASSSTAANPGPCSTDCSGLVSVSLNQAFNNTTYLMSVDSSSGFMEGNGAQFWKEIPISQATAGDIVTRPDHVEIVDHVSGSTVYTDGSHFPGPGGQTGPTSPGMGYYTMAFTWTGPTS